MCLLCSGRIYLSNKLVTHVLQTFLLKDDGEKRRYCADDHKING